MNDEKFEKFAIETKEGITAVHFFEAPALEDLLRAIDEFDTSSILRLWDVSAGLTLSPNQLQQVARHGKSKDFVPGRVAIVAPSDLSFGLSRMYEVYREEERQELRVFRLESEALAWLRGSDEDGGESEDPA